MPIHQPQRVQTPLSGQHNIAIGVEAGQKIGEGGTHQAETKGIIAIGDGAAKSFKGAETRASEGGIFIGVNAGATLTGGGPANACDVIAIGEGAYEKGIDSGNIVVGHEALKSKEIQGGGNVILGNKCWREGGNAAGIKCSENVMIGIEVSPKGEHVGNSVIVGGGGNCNGMEEALYTVSVGFGALHSATVGEQTAIGAEAGRAVTGTNGKQNVFVGFQAGKVVGSEGGSNTMVGYKGGAKCSASSTGNVIVGHEAGPSVEAETNNQLFIHNKAGSSSEALIWGSFENKEVRVNATKMGFFGVAPIAQPAKPTTLAEVIEALEKLGLVA